MRQPNDAVRDHLVRVLDWEDNVEGGPRINDLQHTAYRAVLGLRGDLGDAWSYDAYYQYGRMNYTQVYRPYW